MWKEQVLLRTAEETLAPPKGTEWLINALTTVNIYMSTSAAPNLTLTLSWGKDFENSR